MSAIDWTAIVEAASRAHIKATGGSWENADALTRFGVGQALLPAVRAAVEVADVAARRRAFVDVVAALEEQGQWAARAIVRSLFAAEEGLPS